MDYTLQISGNILTIYPLEDLTTNREYKITLSQNISGYFPYNGGTVDTLESDYTFWFTSIYCPIFTTVSRIKLLVGPSADVLLDDTIFRMIHKNSLDAVELYNFSNATSIPYDYWGCDWQTVPTNIKRYVECKTAYDVLALLKLIRNSNGAGNQLKSLGDLTIKYGSGSENGSPALDAPTRMKEMYDCWNEMLRSFNGIKVSVIGYNDSSKGFSHPVREYTRNRVTRPVVPPRKNYTPGTPNWRGV
jgi:hypothetical protein